MTVDTNAIVGWLASHALTLLVGVVVLVVIYRYAQPLIHRLVVGILHAQQATLDKGGAPAEEVRKRARTIEDLLAKLMRFGVFALIIVLILSVFDLWAMLAGLGLIAAALTIAGQDIILDFLMGILILVEAQYFAGDWIEVVGPAATVQGEVEEVGLRRTVLRDTSGVVHSVSNGLIRASSNLTRVFAVATVDVNVLRTADIDRAIEVINQVGRDLAIDPEWEARVMEAPKVMSVVALTVDGAVLRVRGRVQPADRWSEASELRRRIASALASAQINSARWDVKPGEAGTVDQSPLFSQVQGGPGM
jgi:moderate conductance mechanosensitive channel